MKYRHEFIIERSENDTFKSFKKVVVYGNTKYTTGYIAGYIQKCKDSKGNENADFSITSHDTFNPWSRIEV